MKLRPTFAYLPLVFLLAAQTLFSLAVSAAPPLAGSYKITENTDLGSEVRITVLLNLMNPTSTPVTITKVGLRSISAPGEFVSVTNTISVHSHSSTQISLQFLIAKKDFNAWYKGPHQQFLFTLLPTAGKITLINLPLIRTQG
jgi:hypothetical protein